MDKLASNKQVIESVESLIKSKMFFLAQEQALEALKKTPRDVVLLVTLADVYRQSQDYLSAVNIMERVLKLAPNTPNFLRMTSTVWFLAGFVDRALDLANQYLVASNHSTEAWQLLSNIYEKNGRIEESREALSKIPKTDTNYEMSTLLDARIFYAEKEYDKAIDLTRKYHDWYEAADSSFKQDEEEFYVDSWFQLAKYYDRSGDYDAAWAAAMRAHEIADQVWDHDRYEDQMRVIREFFTGENLRALAHASDPYEQPVFIVGNARSGTSLLEQILSMHPEIGNGGEMMVTMAIQRGLSSQIDSFHSWPKCMFDLRVDDANACSQEYRQATSWFSVGKKRVTNKSIGLQAQVGFLSLILPQSRMIMLHRHPLDNCLSCFTTNLVHTGHYYTESIESLGQMWISRRKMQDYWPDVVEVPVMHLHYDKLVVDQENETRRLLEFLDLPWEDKCLEFHKSRRVAATISYDQVSKKMYASSSGRWKNYEKYLGPLIDIVGDYL